MNELLLNLEQIQNSNSIEKKDIVRSITHAVRSAGYTIVELNDEKPWGAYVRISSMEADRFVKEFFPGLTPEAARLGVKDAELSPKLLIVTPGHRLSWQYHDRRAERWAFLTEGAYKKSSSDEENDIIQANMGDVVQFARSERHRLVGIDSRYAIVAEIWQHSDASSPSDEEDIVRLADDYKR